MAQRRRGRQRSHGGRVRMGLAEGRQLIRDLEESGLSQRAFAESVGVSVGTIQHWRKRVRSEPEFVAVQVIEDDVGPEDVSPWAFEVDLGERRVVRVRSGFREEELVAVLRATSC